MPATLIVTGFLRAHQAAGRPRLPKLERMLARATQREPRHTHDVLAPLFGLEAAAVQPGPFMRLADGGKPDGAYWLRADPVHLAPDRDQLVLMPGSLLEASREELQALAQAFDSIYAAEGWHLEFPQADRGYLRAPRPLDVLTRDPEPFVGGPVFEAMPDGADGKLLKQLMNESQMLFHTHAVNRLRDEVGRPLINSLWCWGGGSLPTAVGRVPKRIVSDLPLVRGLALWAGQDATRPAAGMAISDGDLVALAPADPSVMDRDWFGPLFAQVKSRALHELDIHLEGLGDFSLDSGGARSFWRLPKPVVP